jgi:hypothetical protein
VPSAKLSYSKPSRKNIRLMHTNPVISPQKGKQKPLQEPTSTTTTIIGSHQQPTNFNEQVFCNIEAGYW